MALGSDRGRLGVVDDGEGQGLPAAGVLRGERPLSLADQESIGGDAERGVVMESSPAPPFEVGEAEFALEFLIVAFDAPAQFAVSTRTSIGVSSGRGREPVFGRLALAFGPLDQQPFERCGAVSFPSRVAGRIRTAAKREVRVFGSSPRARTPLAKSPAAASSPASWPRPLMIGLAARPRPRPLQGLGGRGSMPGGQTLIVDCTATA